MLSEFLSRKYTHLFSVLDTDHSGELEEEDFTEFADNVARVRNMSTDSDAYMVVRGSAARRWHMLQDTADRNSDGKVVLEEFLVAMEEMHEQAMKSESLSEAVREWAVLIDLFDVQQRGEIDLHGYREGLQIFGLDGMMDAEASFDILDVDGDGIITEEQAMKLMAEFFFGDDPSDPGNVLLGAF